MAGSTRADVTELVDVPDLGSGVARRGGSSPLIRTTCCRWRATARPCSIVCRSIDMAAIFQLYKCTNQLTGESCDRLTPSARSRRGGFIGALRFAGIPLFYGYTRPVTAGVHAADLAPFQSILMPGKAPMRGKAAASVSISRCGNRTFVRMQDLGKGWRFPMARDDPSGLVANCSH